MRPGDFVGRSFCACARPRRSTPSNPCRRFLFASKGKHTLAILQPDHGRHFIFTPYAHAHIYIRISNIYCLVASPCHPHPAQYRRAFVPKILLLLRLHLFRLFRPLDANHPAWPTVRPKSLLSVHYLSRFSPPGPGPVLARKCGHLFRNPGGYG